MHDCYGMPLASIGLSLTSPKLHLATYNGPIPKQRTKDITILFTGVETKQQPEIRLHSEAIMNMDSALALSMTCYALYVIPEVSIKVTT